jgi:hypothetical protein
MIIALVITVGVNTGNLFTEDLDLAGLFSTILDATTSL